MAERITSALSPQKKKRKNKPIKKRGNYYISYTLNNNNTFVDKLRLISTKSILKFSLVHAFEYTL